MQSPKIQLHRHGLLALAGIALLIILIGAVWTVAVLRVIIVLVVLVAFIQSRLFDSQSTFNAIRKPRKQP